MFNKDQCARDEILKMATIISEYVEQSATIMQNQENRIIELEKLIGEMQSIIRFSVPDKD